MIKIGEKIKELRKAQDITQEKLANYLNISYQAVSKWENGTALPDLSLIPAISNFFGVSSDYLLGIEIDKTNEDIENTLIKVNELNHAGKHLNSIALLEEKLKLYPNNHTLLAYWIESKCNTFDPKCDQEKWLNEIILKCNLILSDCSNDEIRYITKTHMVFAYSFCGKNEIAEKLCNEFPENPYSKVEIMSMIANPPERINYKKKCLAGDLEMLFIDISSIAKHHYCFANPADAIPVCQIALDILACVECEGYLIFHKADIYSDLAYAYSKLNDKEQTLKYLGLAFDTFSELDKLINGETYYYNSPLLKGEYFNRTKVTFGGQMSGTEGFLWTLKRSHSFDWIKTDDDYIKILDNMENNTIRCI